MIKGGGSATPLARDVQGWRLIARAVPRSHITSCVDDLYGFRSSAGTVTTVRAQVSRVLPGPARLRVPCQVT